MKRREPNEILVTFASNLIYLRKDAGLSQAELGKRSGLTHNFINDLENGKKGFSMNTLGKLANALNVEPYLFFLTPEKMSHSHKRELIGVINLINKGVNQVFEDTIKNYLGK